jgi:hypothetical protein
MPCDTSVYVPTEERERLTKYPVSNVSGKNKIVHNVKRRLRECQVTL